MSQFVHLFIFLFYVSKKMLCLEITKMKLKYQQYNFFNSYLLLLDMSEVFANFIMHKN